MSTFEVCPRCGEPKLEHLKTHSHCSECNYSPDVDGKISISKRRRRRSQIAEEENQFEQSLKTEEENLYEC